MKKRAWEPGKKDYDFIRENICIMSPDDMAEYFGVTVSTLNQEKVEAGIVIDDFTAESMSCSEYELDRYLNRMQRTSQWSIDPELIQYLPDITNKIRPIGKYDYKLEEHDEYNLSYSDSQRSEILFRKF